MRKEKTALAYLAAGDVDGLGDAEADEVVLVGRSELAVEVQQHRDAQVIGSPAGFDIEV